MKWSRSEVSAPVVVVSVSIREEIATQRWKVREPPFRVHGIEILLQCAEFRFSIQRWLIVDVVE